MEEKKEVEIQNITCKEEVGRCLFSHWLMYWFELYQCWYWYLCNIFVYMKVWK